MIEKQQCNVITTALTGLDDPGKLRMCELPDGHAGQHQTTYDGRDYHWGAHAADAWNDAAADPTALLDRIATLTADLAEFRAWKRQLQPACRFEFAHLPEHLQAVSKPFGAKDATAEKRLTVSDLERLRNEYNAAGDFSDRSFMNELFHGLDALIEIRAALEEILIAVCKVQDWDGTRVGAAIEEAEKVL